MRHPILWMLAVLAGFWAIVSGMMLVNAVTWDRVWALFAAQWAADTPSWVQAIGTILALGVAIFVPWYQHRLESREQHRKEDLQAGTLAIAIGPELLELSAITVGIREMMDAFLRTPTVGNFVAMIPICRIRLPPVLANSVERLYLLGQDAGPTTQQLVAVVGQFNRLIDVLERQIERSQRDPRFFPPLTIQPLVPHFELIVKLINDAQRDVGVIHNHMVPIGSP